MKLKKYIKFTAQINVLTGLQIGGTESSMEIGELKKVVIRNPLTKLPYIPGSSLKGRFRVALELKYGENDGPEPTNKQGTDITKLFGLGDANKLKKSSPSIKIEPTRLIFRDCNLVNDIEMEKKTEIKMDRNSMSAIDKGLRTMERVPAGAIFDFELMVRIFEGDNEATFMQKIEEAKNIVELEYLGGSGTRGYGKVKFEGWKKVDIAV
jgi:CRISPR-associated protein Csm3